MDSGHQTTTSLAEVKGWRLESDGVPSLHGAKQTRDRSL